MRLDLQMPGDIAGAVVIEREAAEQQHEQQTAEAEDPSGVERSALFIRVPAMGARCCARRTT